MTALHRLSFWCFSSAKLNLNKGAAQFDASIRLFIWFLWFQKQETNKTALQIKRLHTLCAFWFVVYWQSLLLNHLVVQKEEDIWKSAVRSLIFCCPPAPSSLPVEWAVMLELAKTLLSTKAEKGKGINANVRRPLQTICFIHSPSPTRSPISAWIYVFVSFEKRIKFFPVMNFPQMLKVPMILS